ncbi:MAG: hypothetical protein Q9191_006319 [Dirinaria sp. TL-2023a]
MGSISKTTNPKVFLKLSLSGHRTRTPSRKNGIPSPSSRIAAGGGPDFVASGVPIRQNTTPRMDRSMYAGSIASDCSQMSASQGLGMDSQQNLGNGSSVLYKTTGSDGAQTIPPPLVPYQSPALTGRVALDFCSFLQSNVSMDTSMHVNNWANQQESEDLLNKAAVWWLASIMEPRTWSAIRVDFVDQHTCVAELENEITELLRREKQSQAPNAFDINYASSALRSVLEADIKALVEEQARLNSEWEALQTVRQM